MRQKMVWASCLLLAVMTLACISSGGTSVLPTGEAAPVFGVQKDGQTLSLDDLHEHVVLVNFWSST